MKEQSSILTPKNNLIGVKKSEKKEPKLPQPTGWRMLVLPFKMKEKTKGGLVLAETTLERQQVASQEKNVEIKKQYLLIHQDLMLQSILKKQKTNRL
jgi:hypothetical protein